MRTKLTALLILVAASAAADVYTVTNNSDSGAGSLRQAIANANAHPGLDSIDFNLPPSQAGSPIDVSFPLLISSPLILDGATQEGVVTPARVNLTVTGANDGIVVDSGADGTEIRNLHIGGAGTVSRAALRIAAASAVTIAGTILDGANDTAIIISTSGNVIGGLTPAERNVIGGNNVGIRIDGGAAQNIVQGNYIGLYSDGTSPQPNSNTGIAIIEGNDNLIGGNVEGARNVIAASPTGVLVSKPSAQNRIEGNTIGLDANGQASPDLRNAQGVVLGGTGGNEVRRNLISNNHTGIVVIEGFNQEIKGNYIGTDSDGETALPNDTGIEVLNVTSVDELRIGGAITGEANLISGNLGDGIVVDSLSIIYIEGNIIGANVIGEAPLPNQTGVRLLSSENTTLGGPIPTAGNLISGNRGDAVYATSATILSNLIGLSLDRTHPIPNGGNGITGVTDGSLQIGHPSTGNTIAHNGGWGIDISGTGAAAARSIEYNRITGNTAGGIRLRDSDRHTIRFNSIDLNGSLGIDLGGDGTTPNDFRDPDNGPNLRQNAPILTSALIGSNQGVTVRGTLNSTPNTELVLDFYSSSRYAGFYQGSNYLGSATVRTDINGDASILAVFSQPDLGLKVITATATDPSGNTSEFSNGPLVVPPGAPKHRSVRH